MFCVPPPPSLIGRVSAGGCGAGGGRRRGQHAQRADRGDVEGGRLQDGLAGDGRPQDRVGVVDHLLSQPGNVRGRSAERRCRSRRGEVVLGEPVRAAGGRSRAVDAEGHRIGRADRRRAREGEAGPLGQQDGSVRDRRHPRDARRLVRRAGRRDVNPDAGLQVQRAAGHLVADLLQVVDPEQLDVGLVEAAVGDRGADRVELQRLGGEVQLEEQVRGLGRARRHGPGREVRARDQVESGSGPAAWQLAQRAQTVADAREASCSANAGDGWCSRGCRGSSRSCRGNGHGRFLSARKAGEAGRRPAMAWPACAAGLAMQTQRSKPAS